MSAVSPLSLLEELPPFQERSSFEKMRSCLALTDQDEIVRVVDWVKDHPHYGHKILEVRLCDPDNPARGMGWQTDDYRLTPIKTVEGALAQAQAWRALYQARELSRGTDPVASIIRPSRL